MTNTPGANIDHLLNEDLGSDHVIPTGHRELDFLLDGGMRGGDFIVAAGFPGIGTSSFGLGLARTAAIDRRHGTYVACLEANAELTSQRIASASTAAVLHHVRSGELTEDDQRRLDERLSPVRTAPLRITDDRRDLASIREDAFAFGNATGTLRVLFIDGAHLLVPAHDYGGRAQFADDFARDLKELAVLHHLVVVATLPLEMPYANRGSNVPLLRDFNKRQSFAAAADVVILIHRDHYYEPESRRAGEADLIVEKHRGGRRQVITVGYQGHYARFVDMARA